MIKKELERLLIKQSRLTDVYLDNEIGIQIYKSKNTVLKEEEQNLKKQLNLLERKLIEKERSRDYLVSLQDVISNFKETKKPLEKFHLTAVMKRSITYTHKKTGKINKYKEEALKRPDHT